MGTSISIGLPVVFKRFEIGVAYSTPARDAETLNNQIPIATIVRHTICAQGLENIGLSNKSKPTTLVSQPSSFPWCCAPVSKARRLGLWPELETRLHGPRIRWQRDGQYETTPTPRLHQSDADDLRKFAA
jgi:hypothetical protein